jgi:hypothetical protein
MFAHRVPGTTRAKWRKTCRYFSLGQKQVDFGGQQIAPPFANHRAELVEIVERQPIPKAYIACNLDLVERCEAARPVLGFISYDSVFPFVSVRLWILPKFFPSLTDGLP